MQLLLNKTQLQCFAVCEAPPNPPTEGSFATTLLPTYIPGDSVSYRCNNILNTTATPTATCANNGSWFPNPLAPCQRTRELYQVV